MIEDKLELVLITYNRANYLENTLSQLLNSPFRNCKLTILDNCSTDNTPQICIHYKNLFSNMQIIRHKHNIGANANILRAVETSTSLYTWLLADDDSLDFSLSEPVIEAINSERYDVLIFYSAGVEFHGFNGETIYQQLKNYKIEKYKDNSVNFSETHGKELVNIIKHYYFQTLTFIPSNIFKTEIYDSECFIEGYDNIYNKLPHFKFIAKTIENDLSIYVSEKEIVSRGIENSTHDTLTGVNFWLSSSLILKDKKMRDIMTKKMFMHSMFYFVIYAVLEAKANKDKKFRNKIISLNSNLFKTKGFLKGLGYLFLISLLSLIPSSICKYFINKKDSLQKLINN